MIITIPPKERYIRASSGLACWISVGLAKRGQRREEEPLSGLDQFGLDSYVDPDSFTLCLNVVQKPAAGFDIRYVKNRRYRFHVNENFSLNTWPRAPRFAKPRGVGANGKAKTPHSRLRADRCSAVTRAISEVGFDPSRHRLGRSRPPAERSSSRVMGQELRRF
jgi:hypothetical protein